MSQEKVTKYKEAKANRKEIMKQEKRKKLVGNLMFALIPIVLVAGICIGIINTYNDMKPRASVDVKYGVVSEFDDLMMKE